MGHFSSGVTRAGPPGADLLEKVVEEQGKML